MIDLKESEIINACLKFQDDNAYYSDNQYITNTMLGMLKKSPKELARFLEKGKKSTSARTFL